MFRIFIHAFNTRYGVNVRLVGNVFPEPEHRPADRGRRQKPAAAVQAFIIHINGGPKGALTSPVHLRAASDERGLHPVGNPRIANKTAQSEFTLNNAPGGGACPKTLADRPFDPGYTAGTTNPKAGAYSPFELHLLAARRRSRSSARSTSTLPPGMAAKLAGVDYCPEANIAAAATRSGKEELANPSCPANSLVGDVTIKAGLGREPVHRRQGKAYLAGPYKGAPVSLVVRSSRRSPGPYDLGTDVVRTALNVDPETTDVNAVSDDVPFILGGVKLDIRSIDVNLNRNSFTLNPTNCSAVRDHRDISGGGGNPNDPAAWSTVTKNNPFTATDCNALKFKPKFSAKILGGKKATKRRAHPKLQAILQGRTVTRTSPGRRSCCRRRRSSTRATSRRSAPGCSCLRTIARRAPSTATRRRPRR